MCIIINMKKIAAFLLMAAAVFVIGGSVYVRCVAQDTVQLPIIMYHSVLKDTSRTGKYIVTPHQIEEDIEYLSSLGYTSVSAKQVMEYVLDGTPLPPKPYMLTLDDGNYNNLTYVLPILEKYDAYAVISVVGSYSEQFSETGEANAAYSYLRWEDIDELCKSGRVEIGNHSYNMHSISGGRIGSAKARGEDKYAYIEKFKNDCTHTQNLLMQNCGISPVIYTYPFGAYCDESREYLHSAGFMMTLTCNEGINTLTNDPECLFLMQRFNRSGNLRCGDFFQKCGIK